MDPLLLFGPIPDGGDLAVSLLVGPVPAVCLALLVGWDANRRNDPPRAWPTAVLVVGVGSLVGALVVGLLYAVAGRNHPPPDPEERYGDRG